MKCCPNSKFKNTIKADRFMMVTLLTLEHYGKYQYIKRSMLVFNTLSDVYTSFKICLKAKPGKVLNEIGVYVLIWDAFTWDTYRNQISDLLDFKSTLIVIWIAARLILQKLFDTHPNWWNYRAAPVEILYTHVVDLTYIFH